MYTTIYPNPFISFCINHNNDSFNFISHSICKSIVYQRSDIWNQLVTYTIFVFHYFFLCFFHCFFPLTLHLFSILFQLYINNICLYKIIQSQYKCQILHTLFTWNGLEHFCLFHFFMATIDITFNLETAMQFNFYLKSFYFSLFNNLLNVYIFGNYFNPLNTYVFLTIHIELILISFLFLSFIIFLVLFRFLKFIYTNYLLFRNFTNNFHFVLFSFISSYSMYAQMSFNFSPTFLLLILFQLLI